MTRFLGALAITALLAACQNQTHAVFSPAPSPTPHTAPTAAILQPQEVPAGLVPCLGSGPIGVYLATLGVSNSALGAKVAAEWDGLVAQGGRSGAIAVYAAATSACADELGINTSVKTVTSVVVQFRDAAAAERAWEAGAFGFVPPAAAEVAPGVTRGTDTTLGIDSFTVVRGGLRLGSWQRSVFVALVVVVNLDPTVFTAATAAVDARLN